MSPAWPKYLFYRFPLAAGNGSPNWTTLVFFNSLFIQMYNLFKLLLLLFRVLTFLTTSNSALITPMAHVRPILILKSLRVS